MTHLAAWSDVLPGTVITLRRGPLTGERVERTKAWTASGPYVSDTGVACIRVNVAGAVVSYPLDRVSLGYDEPRPIARVPLALALDPPPEDGWSTLARAGAVVVAMLVIYALGFGLGPVLDWLVAP